MQLMNFINDFMASNQLIFFNSGDPKTLNNYGTKIDVNIYIKGMLHIKIGTEQSYEENIRPYLANGIYREHQYDFISIVQIDDPYKTLGALVTAEPYRSQIVKQNMNLLKRSIKLQYNKGMMAAEGSFDYLNKSFKD